MVTFRGKTPEIAGKPSSLKGVGDQQPSSAYSGEGSETIMGAPIYVLHKVGDGIVHSIWKQMVNNKEPGDPGANPGPATRIKMNKNKPILSKREGLVLYWCEGDKPAGRNYMVAITSGDYWIVKNFLLWLRKYFNISKKKIRLRLHLWPDSDEKKAKEYWAKQLDLPLSSFTKTYIKPKSGRNEKYKYGICRAGIYSKKILNEILQSIRKEFMGVNAGE